MYVLEIGFNRSVKTNVSLTIAWLHVFGCVSISDSLRSNRSDANDGKVFRGLTYRLHILSIAKSRTTSGLNKVAQV